ncbi:MAG: ribbon-helix-helix domain-containing protein [Raoultibacter sp.]
MNRDEMNKKLGVSEQQLDAWAQEYDNDTWDSTHLGKVVMGRPLMFGVRMKTVTFKLPEENITALDALANTRGESRSDCLRALVNRALVGASHS